MYARAQKAQRSSSPIGVNENKRGRKVMVLMRKKYSTIINEHQETNEGERITAINNLVGRKKSLGPFQQQPSLKKTGEG